MTPQIFADTGDLLYPVCWYPGINKYRPHVLHIALIVEGE